MVNTINDEAIVRETILNTYKGTIGIIEVKNKVMLILNIMDVEGNELSCTVNKKHFVKTISNLLDITEEDE